MAEFSDLQRGAVLRGELAAVATVSNVRMLGPELALVTFVNQDGAETQDFVGAALMRRMTLATQGSASPAMYPDGVPPLFLSITELRPLLARARTRQLLHPVLQAYIGRVAGLLSTPQRSVHEIHAIAGARNDSLTVSPSQEILWEIFGTAGQVEEDFRKLECDPNPGRLKVAVVLDADVDQRLFSRFTRARQQSSVKCWFPASALMLKGEFERTARRVEEALDALRSTSGGALKIVDFGLAPGSEGWEKVETLPFCYSRSRDLGFGAGLQDPLFFLDVLNTGTMETRVGAAMLNVRFRQTKLHGMPGRTLKPSCTIRLPLNNGAEGPREVILHEPLLCPAGAHTRVLLRLDDAGMSWRGEIEIGLRYGVNNTQTVRVPAVTLLL